MKTFRAVLLADTHLGFDFPSHPRVERRRRGEDFFANFQRVLDHVLRTRPDALIHGGDFFAHSRVARGIVDRAFLALAEVANAGIPVVIAPGNHDRSRLPASIWLGNRNIHVLNEPGTVLVRGRGCTAAVAGFPFVRGDIRAGIAGQIQRTGLERTPADVRLLCVHQTFAGATVGPNRYEFRNAPDVIPRPSLPATLSAVLAGHIHRSQLLDRGEGPPVYYPGSIERTSFAERDEAKGFMDLTFAVEQDGMAPVAEAAFIELPARPMIDVVLPVPLPAEELACFLTKSARQCPPDAVVRIAAESDPEPETLRALTASLLRSCFPATVNIQLARSLFRALD